MNVIYQAAKALLAFSLPLLAANIEDFSEQRINEIWEYVWKSDNPKINKPQTDPLTEAQVQKRLAGRYTVVFGVKPDRLIIVLHTNNVVEVSGQNDGVAWKESGPWRVVSGKLVLFLPKDSLPSFVFSSKQHLYIFDPWAETMMSELKR